MSLKLNTASGGSISIEPTNTASNYTLTIPAETGTIVTADSSGNFSATSLASTNWTVSETGGVLYFAYGGVNKAKLDSSGNLTVVGNVTAYGTV
jgi:hypothetical protein